MCLHGYRQNSKIFREKIGGLRKALKKHAEFVFISAPNRLPESDSESDVSGEYNVITLNKHQTPAVLIARQH